MGNVKPNLCVYDYCVSGNAWGTDSDGHYDDTIVDFHGRIAKNGGGCPYCLGEIDNNINAAGKRGISHYYAIEHHLCIKCGWWKIKWLYVDTDNDTYAAKHLFGEVRHYDVSSLDIPVAALRNYLAKNPKHIAHTHPYQFEKLMYECLKVEYTDCEVVHIGGTGDGGIDIKLIRSDKNTFLVQVKRRSDLSKNEGVSVVRELNGVLFREGLSSGMVITSAKDYTSAAREETMIKTPTHKKHIMELRAFDNIVEMLNLPQHEEYKPWRKALPPNELNGYTINSELF